MPIEQFVAHSFESVDATVSDPTSEQSPDGLAVNAVTFDGSTLGPSWVLGAGATSGSTNVIAADDIDDPSAFVFFAKVNATDDAVLRFYAGDKTDPDRGLLCELSRCKPATGLFVGFATSTDPIADRLMSFDINDPDFDGAALEVKFFFATRRAINGGDQPLSVGRPSHTRTTDDLSTQTDGQTGAVFSAKQPRRYTQAWPFLSHEDTTGLHVIERAWDACGITEPVFSCLDKDTFEKRGRCVLGLFTDSFGAQVEAGMIASGTQAVREMVA